MKVTLITIAMAILLVGANAQVEEETLGFLSPLTDTCIYKDLGIKDTFSLMMKLSQDMMKANICASPTLEAISDPTVLNGYKGLVNCQGGCLKKGDAGKCMCGCMSFLYNESLASKKASIDEVADKVNACFKEGGNTLGNIVRSAFPSAPLPLHFCLFIYENCDQWW